MHEDVYVSSNISNLDKIYSGKNDNAPLSILCCINGKISLRINGVGYNVNSKEILILGTHSIVERCAVSQDTKCNVLYVSERTLFDNMDSIIWENAFTLGKHPIISIDDNTALLFECYNSLFYRRLQQKERLYKDEVISYLLKAIMLELMKPSQTGGYSIQKIHNITLKN